MSGRQMKPVKKTRSPIVGKVVGILQGLALILLTPTLYWGLIMLGNAFADAGHGTAFFSEALMSPFSSTGIAKWTFNAAIAQWVVVGILLAFRNFGMCRFFTALILIAHYIGILNFSAHTNEWQYVHKVLNSVPEIILLYLAAYSASQIFMWFLITRRQDTDCS